MCVAGVDGRPNSFCEPCLVGERWDELRQKLGAYHAAKLRDSAVNLVYPEWLSGSLVSNAFRILLQVMSTVVFVSIPFGYSFLIY